MVIFNRLAWSALDQRIAGSILANANLIYTIFHFKICLESVHSKKEQKTAKDILSKVWLEGSGGGSVGRAVASNTRDPQYESQHWQILFTYFKFR